MTKKRILTSSTDTAIGIVEVMEEFGGLYQKVRITNETNRSNFSSTTKNRKEGDGYVVESRLDVGDKYVTYFRYDKGKVVLEKRFNRVKKTVYLKERVASTEKGDIFLIEWNGQKSINFNIKNISSNDRIK
jgi:uncharacterized membrane protein